MAGTREDVLDDATITERLGAELPHWTYEGGWIKRTYKTASWKSTLMVINTVGHLAEAAWHHPDLTASYAWVEVRQWNGNWWDWVGGSNAAPGRSGDTVTANFAMFLDDGDYEVEIWPSWTDTESVSG